METITLPVRGDLSLWEYYQSLHGLMDQYKFINRISYCFDHITIVINPEQEGQLTWISTPDITIKYAPADTLVDR